MTFRFLLLIQKVVRYLVCQLNVLYSPRSIDINIISATKLRNCGWETVVYDDELIIKIVDQKLDIAKGSFDKVERFWNLDFALRDFDDFCGTNKKKEFL